MMSCARYIVGAIASSEDMIEIDFKDGTTIAVGEQYGIGRRQNW